MSIPTIHKVAPKVIEVSLYWSVEGPASLEYLKYVKIHILEGSLESASRNDENFRSFKKRLGEMRQKVRGDRKVENLFSNIVVEAIYPKEMQISAKTNDIKETEEAQAQKPQKWVKTMEEFGNVIDGIKTDENFTPVKVALIDDGVDVSDRMLWSRVYDGESFCPRAGALTSPFYTSIGGHGTAMAKFICGMCSKAKLFVLKLNEPGGSDSREITAESAALAVKKATEEKVDIISMSWTIEKTDKNVTAIKDLEDAIAEAAEAGIILFCASIDEGIKRDESYPAAGRTAHLFKIGVATADGAKWKYSSRAQLDYIFPGDDVYMEGFATGPGQKLEKQTGSSVATAIAAGLAALIVTIVRMAALHTESLDENTSYKRIDQADADAMKGYDAIDRAFKAIGTNETERMFVEVDEQFGHVKDYRRDGGNEAIEIVAEIATIFRRKQLIMG